MANLNRIILIGRLTADPDVRVTVDGTPMTKFRLAVNRFQREGSPQTADFIDIITWRRLAEICGEHLKKGRLVLVEGRIQVRSYDEASGVRKWVTEVIARNMQMLPSGEEEIKVEKETLEEEFEEEADFTEASEDLPF